MIHVFQFILLAIVSAIAAIPSFAIPADSDNDGVMDWEDYCPNTPARTKVWTPQRVRETGGEITWTGCAGEPVETYVLGYIPPSQNQVLGELENSNSSPQSHTIQVPPKLIDNGIDRLRDNLIASFQAMSEMSVAPKSKIYKKAAAILAKQKISIPLFLLEETICSHFLIMDALMPIIENTSSKSFEPVISKAQIFHKKLKANVRDCSINTRFDLTAILGIFEASLDALVSEGISNEDLIFLSKLKTTIGTILALVGQEDEQRPNDLNEMINAYSNAQKTIERFLTHELYRGIATSIGQSMDKLKNLDEKGINTLIYNVDLIGPDDSEIRDVNLKISEGFINAAILCLANDFYPDKLLGKFVRIPNGSFLMGSPDGEAGRYGNERQHRVTISKDFYMSEKELTQAEWFGVIGDNPSHFKEKKYCPDDHVVKNGIPMCPNHPVEKVSWDDVQDFIEKLNKRGTVKYRLPTEAEWEYAARAGTTTPYNLGETITKDKVNFDGTQTVAVGSLKNANEWGLYDMHGNVLEWNSDWNDNYYYDGTSPENDLKDPRVFIRGGSWRDLDDDCRSPTRFYAVGTGHSGNIVGFRLVLENPFPQTQI